MAEDNVIEVRFTGDASGLEVATRAAAQQLSELNKAAGITSVSMKQADEKTALFEGSTRGLMRSVRLATYGLMQEMSPALGTVAMTLDRVALSAQLTGGRLAGFAGAATAIGAGMLLLVSHLNKAREEWDGWSESLRSFDGGKVTSEIQKITKELRDMESARKAANEQLPVEFRGLGYEFSDTDVPGRRERLLQDQSAAMRQRLSEINNYQRNIRGMFAHEDYDPTKSASERVAIEAARLERSQGVAQARAALLGSQAGTLGTQANILRAGGRDAEAYDKEVQALAKRREEITRNLQVDLEYGRLWPEQIESRKKEAAAALSQADAQRQLLDVQERRRLLEKDIQRGLLRMQPGDPGFDPERAQFESLELDRKNYETEQVRLSGKGVELAREAFDREMNLHSPEELLLGTLGLGGDGRTLATGDLSERQDQLRKQAERLGVTFAEGFEEGTRKFAQSDQTEERKSFVFDLAMKPLRNQEAELSRMRERAFGGRNYLMSYNQFKSQDPGTAVGEQVSAGFQSGIMRTVDQLGTWGENMERVVSGTASAMSRSFDDLFFDSVTGNFAKLPDFAKNIGTAIVREITGALSRMTVRSILEPMQSQMSQVFGSSGLRGFAPVGMVGGAGALSSAYAGGGYIPNQLAGQPGAWGGSYASSAEQGVSGVALPNMPTSSGGSGVLGMLGGGIALGAGIYGAFNADSPTSGVMSGVTAGIGTYSMLSGMGGMSAASGTGGLAAGGAAAAPYTMGISLAVAAVVAGVGFMVGSSNKKKRLRAQKELEERNAWALRENAGAQALLTAAQDWSPEQIDALLGYMTVGSPFPTDIKDLAQFAAYMDLSPGGDIARALPETFQSLLNGLRGLRDAAWDREARTAFSVRVNDRVGGGLSRSSEMLVGVSDPAARLAAARERSAFGEVLLGIDDGVSERLLRKLLSVADQIDMRLTQTPRWQGTEG